MIRGIVDGYGLYDTVPGGKDRDIWLEITPRSFNVRVKEGLALTQLMIFEESASEPLDVTKEKILYSGENSHNAAYFLLCAHTNSFTLSLF